MSSLTSEHKAKLKQEITKVKPDTEDQLSVEKIPLQRLVESYLQMRVKAIQGMRKCRDPVFLEMLHYAQEHLTREEFYNSEIEVYAICNQIAMDNCTPVDNIEHDIVLHEAVQ